jgi:hypothetical protein
MGRVQEKISQCLAAEVEGRAAWDEPPGLYFLYLEGGKPRLSGLRFPDGIWASGRPPEVLDAVSRCWDDFRGLLRQAAPQALHGAAFRCEMWRVETPPEDSPEYQEARRMALQRRLREHLDRVEGRSMWAVDRAGIAYGAVLDRGTAHARVMPPRYPGAAGRITGTIPEALDRIVTAMLGVTIR